MKYIPKKNSVKPTDNHNSKSKIRVGIIGMGYGLIQLKELSNDLNYKVIAISDNDQDKLNEISKTYKEILCYPNYMEMVEESSFDLIIISTPNNTHFKIFSDILPYSKDILLEKPVFLEAEEFLNAKELIKKNNVNLYVGHTLRCNPSITKIKEIIKNNKLGNILRINIRLLQSFGSSEQNYYKWYHNKAEGGGQLNMVATHLLDLLELFFGKFRIERMYCEKYVVQDSRPDKNGVKHNVDAEEGFSVNINLVDKTNNIYVDLFNTTYSYGADEFEIELYGQDGLVVYNSNTGLIGYGSVESIQDLQYTNDNNGLSIFSNSFKYFLEMYSDRSKHVFLSSLESSFFVYNLLKEINGKSDFK